jgi:hypothetical protein
MSGSRALASLLAVVATALALTASAGAADEVAVTVDRSHVATQLGRRFTFRTTVANEGGAATTSLIAHLNVLSLQPGTYVDPEDWSGNRTRYLGTIPAGESRTITWSIHAVNDGSFAAYITVLPQAVSDEVPTTSAVVEFDVQKRTTLNSGGILPLALGIPALLGLLAATVHVSRRRR